MKKWGNPIQTHCTYYKLVKGTSRCLLLACSICTYIYIYIHQLLRVIFRDMKDGTGIQRQPGRARQTEAIINCIYSRPID